MTWILKDKNFAGEIDLDVDTGFSFVPKINSDIAIDNVIIYDNNLINNFLYHRFMNKYKKLVALVIKIMQDDSTTNSDVAIALNEIEKQKEIVLHKYHIYLQKEKEKNYLKKLVFLEMELKNKYEIYRNFMDMTSKSR